MADIFSLLAKHFSGISTDEEEVKIKEFRKSNPAEYEMLMKFWNKGELTLQDFDTKAAWKQFMLKIPKPVKIIPFYRNFRNIAAAIIIIIVSSISAYFLSNHNRVPEQIITENKTSSSMHIFLADGSTVYLNKDAILTYPADFIGRSRQVALAGTAFFEISKDEEHPFIIETKTAKITVLGTSFNINSNSTQTEVTVRSGIVEVKTILNDEKVIIKQNQVVVAEQGRLTISEINNPNYLSWQSGVFEFNNTPIAQVIKDLNTYYSVQLELDTIQINNCSLSARFEKSSLEEILQILETTCDFSIIKDNNIIVIK